MIIQHHSKLQWSHFSKWKLNRQAIISTMPESRLGKILLSNPVRNLQGFIGIAIIPSGTHPSTKKRSHFLAYCKGVHYPEHELCLGWEQLKHHSCMYVDRSTANLKVLGTTAWLKLILILLVLKNKPRSITNVKIWHTVTKHCFTSEH